jgi:hypothetical protein
MTQNSKLKVGCFQLEIRGCTMTNRLNFEDYRLIRFTDIEFQIDLSLHYTFMDYR